MAESMDQMVEALHILQEEAAKVGLQVNWNKTKIMVVDPSSSITNPPVALDKKTTIDVVSSLRTWALPLLLMANFSLN